MKIAAIAVVFLVAGLSSGRLLHPAVANEQKEVGFPPAYIEEADDVSKGVGRVSLGWGRSPYCSLMRECRGRTQMLCAGKEIETNRAILVPLSRRGSFRFSHYRVSRQVTTR